MPTREWSSWFAGLVDGEACFSLGKNNGHWFKAEFRILMRADDRPMMEEIRRTLGFGSIRSRPGNKGSKPCVIFSVDHRRDQMKLVQLFDQFPLRSRKRRDYEVWRTFVLLHQDRRNANNPEIEELIKEIRSVREFKE